MKKFRTGENRKQIALLPPSVDEYVGRDDLVRYVDGLVEEFDLENIEASYSRLGRPAYSPRMLVKVILYGKMRGVRSGRELSRACKENLKFIYLTGKEKPDFRTINDFRKNHTAELAGLLKQTIEVGIREDLIDLAQVSLDGTKIGAFAGRGSFKTPEKLREALNNLEAELKVSFAADVEAEQEQDAYHGESDGEVKLPPDLQSKEKLAERLRAALKEYENCDGEAPKSISVTDPESRMMKGKGINPSYNGQAAIDIKSRMVVAGYAVNACADSAELIPVIDEIKENTGKEPKQVIADKGYTEQEHLVKLEERKIEGFILQRKDRNQEFTYNEEKDSYTCPEGRELYCVSKGKKEHRYFTDKCAGCARKSKCSRCRSNKRVLTIKPSYPAAQRMRRKLNTAEGKKMSILRSATIEPLFGFIKYARGLRQMTVRGLARVSDAWKLELASYNIEKLYRAAIA